MDKDQTDKKAETFVPDVHRVPLAQLVGRGSGLHRILPKPGTPKPPIATFDATM